MEFRILGPLEIRHDGSTVACKGTKQRLLLATLLLHANQVVSSDRLIEALWGDEPPPTASKALQMHISGLRRLLEPDVLVTRPPGYELRVSDGELDLHVFERNVAQARAAADPSRASALFEDALSLWRGAPLADLTFEECLQPEIGRLDELRLTAVEDRLDADLELGRHAELVPELEALAAAHPLRERIRAQLMLALYRGGRQADALEVYRQTRRLLVEELGLEPSRSLKTLEEQILAQASELDPPRPSRTVATEGLIGRQRELAELLPILDSLASGPGAVVLIAGEPGIGKSRLADALARHAGARGATVAVGRCWEAGGAPAFWPWAQALQSLGGDDLFGDANDPADDDSGARFRMFAAISAFLRGVAARAPVAIFLDDIHAADAASLLLLRFVASQLADMPLLVVGCYRDTETGPDLAKTLGELVREPAVHRLNLAGLEPEATAELLAATMGGAPANELVARVQAETRGNPLFAGEIARLLVNDDEAVSGQLPIPDGVREAIRRRLERQSPGCQQFLVFASVLGREFDLATVAHLAELEDEPLLAAVEEATAARLIASVPGARERLRFAHILVRDVIYDELSAPRRLRLHRAAGETLEALHSANLDPHMTELAHHFVAAGSLAAGKAATYAERAGELAARRHGYEEAARHYASALDLVERHGPPDPERMCDLLLSLGDAHSRAGNAADAKEAIRRAAAMAAQHGWRERLVEAALVYAGRFAWARASTDPAYVPLLEQALEATGENDPRARARLLARLASAIRDEPSRQRRTALAEESVEIARRSGDALTLAYALEGKGVATEGIDPAHDIVPAAELAALGEQLGDKERIFTARSFRINAYWKLADRPGIEVEIDALAALADELHQPAQQWSVGTERVVLALVEGRFADAEEMIARTRSIGERVERWNARVSERLQLFVLRRAQGRLAELEDVIRRSVHEYPTLLRFRCALAHLYAELANGPAARSALEEVPATRFGSEYLDAEWLFTANLLPDVYRMLGDEPAAARLYELLLPHERLYAHAPSETTFGSVARGLGILATMLGRFGDAERHFSVAIENEQSLRARPWLAHAQHEMGAMLLERGAWGDDRTARGLLEDAISGYEDLGMGTWAARARGLASS